MTKKMSKMFLVFKKLQMEDDFPLETKLQEIKILKFLDLAKARAHQVGKTNMTSILKPKILKID